GGGSGGPGITTLPHLRDFIIKGPRRATGISETPSRARIFSCRPTTQNEERPCARQILSKIAGEAYRRPLAANELDRLMPIFDKASGSGGCGRSGGGFESGIRAALGAVVAGTYILFRVEKASPCTTAG